VNYAEGWLLDAVHDSRTRLDQLVSPDIRALFNMPGHGLSAAAVAFELAELACRGWIEFCDSRNTLVALSENELRAELERPGRSPIVYGLTVQGGRFWEVEAEADWSRFVYSSSIDEDDAGRNLEVVCADGTRARDWLALRRSAPSPMTIETHAEIWDVREPIEATYWKTLTRGHRVRYRESKPPPKIVSSCSVVRREWDAWKSRYEAFTCWKRDLYAP